jgi:hypothetical protein
MESLLDPLKYEDLVLRLYLTDGIGVEALLLEGNLTRCQRASEGTEQSATSRCNQVIEGGRVRFHFLRGGSVVFGDFAMSTEQHEVLLRRKMRPPNHALDRIYSNPRDVRYLSHQQVPSIRCSYSNLYTECADTNH